MLFCRRVSFRLYEVSLGRWLQECCGVLPELAVQVLGRGAEEGGCFGVEGCYGGWRVVGLEEEAVEGAGAQALGVVAKAEADVEAMVQELA